MSATRRAVVVSTVIGRSPGEVWADVRDIASHVTWMQDAAASSATPRSARSR